MLRLQRSIVAGLLLGLGAMGETAEAQQGAATARQGQPPPATDVQGNGSLSDKLSTTNGVIHPDTNVDPAMRKAPADTGSAKMPVIPPPGTAGGGTAVQPK